MILPLSKAIVIILGLNNAIIVAAALTQPFQRLCEMQAFKEHMEIQHLRDAIILHNGPKLWARNETERKYRQMKNEKISHGFLKNFTNYHFLEFFNINEHIEGVFKPQSREYPARRAVFLPYTSEGGSYRHILLSASAKAWFSYPISWFVFMQDDAKEHLANIRRTFGTLNIQLNADVTVAYKRDNCIFDLYDIHKVCHKCGSPLLVERKGNWSPEHGMRIHEKFKLSFIAQRQNWANASVNVGTALLNFSPDLHMPIMEYLEDNKRFLQNDLMQRKTYQLMKMVQELFNCTFATKILKDWGIRQNDSWTGLMKSIDSNEVEFSICPLRFTRERFHAVFYSPELHVEKIRFLLRHPKGSHMRNIFFEPLTYHVWCCVLALIVITAFLLTIYMHAEYQLYWKVNMSEGGRPLAPNNEPQMDFAIFTTLETIFMQGPSPDQFRLNSIRLLLISVSVFAVLLMQYYGAYIVSSLLSEAPRSITNLPALYESNLEIGMENISYNFELFGTATNQVVRNIYKKRICRKGIPNVMSMEQGVQRIAQGGFALHASVNRAYRILADILDETEFCELQEITFNTPFSAGLAMSKATPYRKFITTAILKFRESSLLLYNDRQWEIPHIDCATKSKNDVVVDLQHFAPVLVFLAFAILTSIWVFIMELLLHKHNQRQIHVNFKNICNTMHKYLSNKQ